MFTGIFLVGRRVAAWRQRRRACRQLHALDDRMLKDMGIERSRIEMIVRGVESRHRRRW